MKAINSPYIRFANISNSGFCIYNFLVNKFQSIKKEYIDVMFACVTPQTITDLENRFGVKLISQMRKSFLLLDPDEMWKMHRVSTMEIETSTVCNWRCEYCPVKSDTREKKFIEFKLFEQLIQKAREYKCIKEIGIHSFNEPSLDPNFHRYSDMIFDSGFKFLIFTNGSMLDEKNIKNLSRFKERLTIVFNFPSISKDKFNKMTGSNSYERSCEALRLSFLYGITTHINVQGIGADRENEARKVFAAFPKAKMISYDSSDRGGAVKNKKYLNHIDLTDDRMRGCYTLTRSIYVTVDGHLDMCCNDYGKKYLIGDIRSSTIDEALSGESACEARKKVWGALPAEKSFLCRSCILMKESFEEEVYLTFDSYTKKVLHL